ncbi:MAG: hypothetical protein Q8O43_04065 [Dehalococcoidia bacterium]|nr:hypothetical protein [Dehalococcoidia bacterium]
MSAIKKAILRSFNSGVYTATVEIKGSGKVYLESVPVAKNIPTGEMVAGRQVVVVFFDEHNARDAVVVAVY